MALYGKFTLNNADYSQLIFPGVGSFMAFSGDGIYRNRGGCGIIPDKGPLPPGKYYVVDRPDGSWFNGVRAWGIDMFKSIFYYHVDHSEWFALYRDDGMIDDTTFINKVSRGGFRLHPGRVSDGCITIARSSDFSVLRTELLRTAKIQVPGTKLTAYGTIEVIANDNTCP